MKIVVLDGDVINPGDISWAPLEKLGEVAIYGDTPEDLIVERAAGAEVLVTNKVPLRSGTLSRLPDLRMVAVLATGYDIIDTADAAAHGIPVCNVVAYGVDDVAQHAWALLLELCRRTGEHTASVRAGEWKDTWCYWKTTPVCLRGRTLGVIGFGSIGRRVGELGHAFGMSVLANCRTPRNPPSYSPFAFASTDQIFQQADVISLHCPLTDATRAIINAKALARMKPGAILINTARGPLLDEAAVAEARKDLVGSGQQGGGDTGGKANRTACGNIGTGKDDTACNAQCNGQLGRRQGDDVHNGRKGYKLGNPDGDEDNRQNNDDVHGIVEQQVRNGAALILTGKTLEMSPPGAQRIFLGYLFFSHGWFLLIRILPPGS